jgi:hypothetical protein
MMAAAFAEAGEFDTAQNMCRDYGEKENIE